jgi:hypothetical protein
MNPCFVCATLAPCTPYRLGNREVVMVYLCAECGASFEQAVADWLERMQARPRQVAMALEAS